MIKTDKVIYRNRTQEEYYWLLDRLDEAGCVLKNGSQARTAKVHFGGFHPDLCIRMDNQKMAHSDFDFYKNESDYKDYEFIEVSDLMHPYKDTAGKPKLSLVPPQIIFDIAEVREYRSAKYPDGGKDNWKKVDIDDYKDALLKHTLKYLQDPKGKDE